MKFYFKIRTFFLRAEGVSLNCSTELNILNTNWTFENIKEDAHCYGMHEFFSSIAKIAAESLELTVNIYLLPIQLWLVY